VFVQELRGVINQPEGEQWTACDIQSMTDSHVRLSCQYQELHGQYEAKCRVLEALQRDHDSRVLEVHALRRELTAARDQFETNVSHQSLDFEAPTGLMMRDALLSVAEVGMERANVEHEARVKVLKGHCSSVIRSIQANEEESRSGLSLIDMSYLGRAAEICKSRGLQNIPLNFAMALVNGSLKTDDDETFIFAKLLSDQSANLHKEPNGRKWSEEVTMYFNECLLGKYSKRAHSMHELNLLVPSASTLAVSGICWNYTAYMARSFHCSLN